MSIKKTLVILTPGFPHSEADTTCLPMQQQFVRALKKLYPEFEIVVLTFQYPYHKNEYTWFGIRVIPFAGRNKGGLPKVLLRNKINSTLKNVYHKTRIVGLFSFWYNECAFVGKKFADKYDLKHYCWILGQDAKEANKYPKLLPPRSDELIALSDFVQQEFERNHGIRPGCVIPPGIDETLFGKTPAQKDIDVLGVGSLIPLKQYDIFLEIIAQVKKQIPGIKALLVGKGPQKENLESLIDKFELKSNVTMTGELSYDEVLKLMARTKVFLHPSSYEGFGCVCLEALYAGAQVISFCQPLNMQITNWHIAKDKEAAIVKALNILTDQYIKFSSVKGFDINKTAASMMKLLEEK